MCNCWFTPMMNNIVPWGRDMFGGIPGSMNILYNQCFTDLQARASMWQVPAFGFGLNTYSGMPCTGLEGLLDPRYTWCQQMWNMASGQGGIFGNMGFGNMSNPFWANGFNFGNTQNSSNNGSDSTADQKKYNKLLSLLKQLNARVQREDIKYTMDEDTRERLEELIKGSKKKTYQEKYEELKEFYDKLNKEDIKKFITKDSGKLTFNGKNGDKISAKLYDAGYETDTSDVDKDGLISQMYDALKNKNNSDANISAVMECVDNYSIMEVLSSYYTAHKSTGNEDLITVFLDTYKKINGDAMKSTFKTGFQPVINALVNEAKSVADQLDEADREALTKKADDLSKAYTDWKPSDIKKLFKEVYLMTRLASTRRIEERLKDNYGSIDDTLFKTDSFIMEDVISDLKEEGFTDAEIKNANKTVNVANSDSKQKQTTGLTKEVLDAEKEEEKEEANEDNKEANEYAYITGYKVYRGTLNGNYSEKVIGKLKSLDKSTVVDFLKEFNYKEGHWGRFKGYGFLRGTDEGLLEFLIDDGGENYIDDDAVINLIESVLNYAKDKKQSDNEHYRNIESALGELKESSDAYDYLNGTRDDIVKFWHANRKRKCEYLDCEINELLKDCGNKMHKQPKK